MNATIHGIIDHMFRDTIDNAETRALHEELLNNCLEHYDDLLSRGMSDTEAIDAVVESLKGMKEVIDEYPKKPGASQAKEAEEKAEEPRTETEKTAEETVPLKEKPSEYAYNLNSVRKFRTDLKNCDLKIGRSPDDRIHVRCEDMEQLVCSLDGGTLSVRILDRARKSLEEAGQKMVSQDFTVKGLLSVIGKAIGTVASSITMSWNVYIDLPDAVLAEMDLNAKSGDVTLNACLPERLNVHNMSGDVTVKAVNNNPAGRVTITTMSGEIEFSGNAFSILLSSMSGDVSARGIFQLAELKSTSGDTEVNGEAEQIRLNSVSGDAEAELRNTTVRSILARSTSGDVNIFLAPGTDSVHAVMSSVSGSTSCAVADSGAGARLQIQAGSVSGDVKIR